MLMELTLDMAERAAKAALAKAKQLGTVMTASVVDESGRTVLIMRGDCWTRLDFVGQDRARGRTASYF